MLVKVKDNGKGMSKLELENLLSKNPVDVKDYEHSYKMGYVFIRDFIKQINGEIKIESIEGKGTTVLLTISND